MSERTRKGAPEAGARRSLIVKTANIPACMWSPTWQWSSQVPGLSASMSAVAMLRYFEPLMAYLQQVNTGREATLPEL